MWIISWIPRSRCAKCAKGGPSCSLNQVATGSATPLILSAIAKKPASRLAITTDVFKKLGIAFEEQNIENAGYQVFLYDPVGTKLEFNFLNEHVPDAVPLGTTAGANLR